MELYNGRLDKTPGAIALRHRWYGTGTPELGKYVRVHLCFLYFYFRSCCIVLLFYYSCDILLWFCLQDGHLYPRSLCSSPAVRVLLSTNTTLLLLVSFISWNKIIKINIQAFYSMKIYLFIVFTGMRKSNRSNRSVALLCCTSHRDDGPFVEHFVNYFNKLQIVISHFIINFLYSFCGEKDPQRELGWRGTVL